jgi:atypical dual specificity phosphatase
VFERSILREIVMLFRQASLPPEIHGKLYLHSMPGRYEPLSDIFKEIQALSIDRIICLAPQEEIEEKSAAYAKAIKMKQLPCAFTAFPIQDFNVPDDRQAFTTFVSEAATELRDSQKVLLHCAGGIGRTGTVACCILMALGCTKDASMNAIAAAGSGSETEGQRNLLAWYAKEVSSIGHGGASPA